MWGGRTENIPESRRKQPSRQHVDCSDGETAPARRRGPGTESGAPQSGKLTRGNEDASPLLGMFFQLKSWELESVNNDLGLQTTLQRHDGEGITCTLQNPEHLGLLPCPTPGPRSVPRVHARAPRRAPLALCPEKVKRRLAPPSPPARPEARPAGPKPRAARRRPTFHGDRGDARPVKELRAAEKIRAEQPVTARPWQPRRASAVCALALPRCLHRRPALPAQRSVPRGCRARRSPRAGGAAPASAPPPGPLGRAGGRAHAPSRPLAPAPPSGPRSPLPGRSLAQSLLRAVPRPRAPFALSEPRRNEAGRKRLPGGQMFTRGVRDRAVAGLVSRPQSI